jgi:hypothetical protein
LDKVASLAEMLLKAKEKLSQGHTNSHNHPQEHFPSTGDQNPPKQIIVTDSSLKIGQGESQQTQTSQVANKPKKKKDKPTGIGNEARSKMVGRDPQLQEKKHMKGIPKTKTIEKNTGKVPSKNPSSDHGDGDEEEDESDVIERYFKMKRKAAQVEQHSASLAFAPAPLEPIRIRSQRHREEEEDDNPHLAEYIPASPMFPTSGDLEDEGFPMDLPFPSKKSSPLIDPTPLDLSYFSTSKEKLLDHKSHSILEEDEEEEERKEGEQDDGTTPISFDRGNFSILEDEGEEGEGEEGEEVLQSQEIPPSQLIPSPTREELIYEDDWEEGHEESVALSKSQSLHNNQQEDSDEEEGEEEWGDSRDGHEGGRGGGEDDSSDATSMRETSDDYEKLLNFECENLRRRLEEKIVLSQQAEAEEGEDEEEDREGEEDYDDDYEEEEEEEEGGGGGGGC